MDYSGLIFLLKFLPVFLLCYYAAPGRVKNLVLLLGSLCFYAWGRPTHAGLALLCVAVNYLLGRILEHWREKPTGRFWLMLSVSLNLGYLFLFGYADFLTGTGNTLLGTHFPMTGLLLPLGCTVYTLQAISYLADIFHGKTRAARSLLDFAVYLVMFPQSAVGPIVRYRDMEKSLAQRKTDLHQISRGAKRACIGLAKKVLIADGAGELWNVIAGMNLAAMSAATAWLGILAFAFRMYFYFSGFSDLAIGLADCLGFSFPENFGHPFIARSVTEFWSKWQISLGSWMREYVYLPMGGSRKGLARQILAMIVVWGLTGFWYGADWTFVLWGLWGAFFLLLEKLFLRRILKALPGFVGWAYTTVVLALGWVLFAMDHLPQAWAYFRVLFGGSAAPLADERFFYLGKNYLPVLALGILFSTPLFYVTEKRLESGRSGAAMACYRLGEKVIPGLLLIASLVRIIGLGA